MLVAVLFALEKKFGPDLMIWQHVSLSWPSKQKVGIPRNTLLRVEKRCTRNVKRVILGGQQYFRGLAPQELVVRLVQKVDSIQTKRLFSTS